MWKEIHKYIYPKLSSKNFDSDNELYLYLILSVATAFSMFVHIFLLVLFGMIHANILVIPNILSVIIYCICFSLLKRRKYALSGLLFTFEIMIYTLVSIYITGIDSNIIFYLFIILILQVIIPYASIAVRGVVVFIIWVSIIAAILMGTYLTPIVDISKIKLLLSIFNIHVGFFGALTELLIGNVITEVIGNYNKIRMQELESQAYTDALTGLYNRRYGAIFFNEIAERRTPFGWYVATLDIDNFKRINDTYGHSAGDKVLETLASLMRNNLRKTDVLFRWGGEEFLLFLADVNEQDAFHLLDKLRKIISSTIVAADNKKIQFTVTIGAVKVDIHHVKNSISDSDKKLYIGKNEGKNKVVM